MENYAKENQRYWTQRAPSYSQVNREELATAQRQVWSRTLDERIRGRFPFRRREQIRVLDVGTGPGFFAILLTELGYDVTAVDYTPAMLAQARENAGDLGEHMKFYTMDAQDLTFSDHSFDVVVSRNLTWNLPQPQQAYAQWARVLRPGGLLLNFDANWYRYLFDPQAQQGHLQDRANVQRLHAADDTAGTDVEAMEAIARQAPLSAQHRPAWDLETLTALGLEAEADLDVWQRVWTRDEWLNNASTPMFLVCAAKPTQGEVGA